MIKIEKTEVVGLEPAIRGMRNPKNSWDRSDSSNGGYYIQREIGEPCSWHRIDNPTEEDLNDDCTEFVDDDSYIIGPNDHKLMSDLAAGGPVHAKYRRMIVVYVDITAPLYWWKEFDTYKVGTVANSCSTMHKIHANILTLHDFSCEHLSQHYIDLLDNFIMEINKAILYYRQCGDKEDWWQIIQLLPSSYNQKRTVMLNYEVLVGIYKWRRNHKLDEWREFCKWIENLPYSELITGELNVLED